MLLFSGLKDQSLHAPLRCLVPGLPLETSRLTSVHSFLVMNSRIVLYLVFPVPERPADWHTGLLLPQPDIPHRGIPVNKCQYRKGLGCQLAQPCHFSKWGTWVPERPHNLCKVRQSWTMCWHPAFLPLDGFCHFWTQSHWFIFWPRRAFCVVCIQIKTFICVFLCQVEMIVRLRKLRREDCSGPEFLGSAWEAQGDWIP